MNAEAVSSGKRTGFTTQKRSLDQASGSALPQSGLLAPGAAAQAGLLLTKGLSEEGTRGQSSSDILLVPIQKGQAGTE